MEEKPELAEVIGRAMVKAICAGFIHGHGESLPAAAEFRETEA
jgi:hypothetical protein